MTTLRGNRAKTSRATTEHNVPDEQRFQQVYQENQRLIYRYVSCWVNNREDVEDLTSLIFLKAWQKGDFLRSPKAIQKWLFQVARTTIADYWRTRSRENTCSLDELLGVDWDDPDQEESRVTNKPSAYRQRNLHHLSTRSLEEDLLDAEPESPGHEGLTATGSGPTGGVQRLLQALPEQYREVLTYRFLCSLSIRETAQRMGLTVANVKVIQFRALKRAAESGDVARESGGRGP